MCSRFGRCSAAGPFAPSWARLGSRNMRFARASPSRQRRRCPHLTSEPRSAHPPSLSRLMALATFGCTAVGIRRPCLVRFEYWRERILRRCPFFDFDFPFPLICGVVHPPAILPIRALNSRHFCFNDLEYNCLAMRRNPNNAQCAEYTRRVDFVISIRYVIRSIPSLVIYRMRPPPPFTHTHPPARAYWERRLSAFSALMTG